MTVPGDSCSLYCEILSPFARSWVANTAPLTAILLRKLPIHCSQGLQDRMSAVTATNTALHVYLEVPFCTCWEGCNRNACDGQRMLDARSPHADMLGNA